MRGLSVLVSVRIGKVVPALATPLSLPTPIYSGCERPLRGLQARLTAQSASGVLSEPKCSLFRASGHAPRVHELAGGSSYKLS